VAADIVAPLKTGPFLFCSRPIGHGKTQTRRNRSATQQSVVKAREAVSVFQAEHIDAAVSRRI
jgi:hypothetical protein